MEINKKIIKYIKKKCATFTINQNMADLTSFKCGGNAKFFCEPKNTISLINIVKYLNKYHLSYFILGRGTNTLFKNFNGFVISTKNLDKVIVTKHKVKVQCGVSLFKLNQKLFSSSLSGLEFSVGIPGSVGGAITMNAGAYGDEVGNFVERVKVLNKNKVQWIKKNDLKFSYRNSSIKDNNYIVLCAEFKLNFADKNDIQVKMQNILEKRRIAQPLNYASAGSVFKRNGDIIPAKIIDNLGLKGLNINDAQISEKHAGFIVNKGNAKFEEVIALIEKIEQIVKEKKGILLEREINIIGD